MPWVARSGDRETFLRMAPEFLRVDGLYLDCDQNRDAMRTIFDRLLREPNAGVLVMDQGGFSLALAANGELRMTAGKAAAGVGTYVLPEKRREGVATALRSALIAELRDRGFESLMGTVALTNEAGMKSLDSFGFKPEFFIGFVSIGEA